MSQSQALVTGKQSMSVSIDWNDPQMQLQVKENFGSKLSEPEWKLFLALGQATGLNPFLKEMWAVKYGTAPASIFIGRDGYRRSAQAHPEYDYHEANAVYSNDEFSIDTIHGTVNHAINTKDRGEVVGAYCIVKRKSASRPVVTFIDRKEYDKKQSVWKEMPATMCKKVAEAQGLRASFQELFKGTYEESEESVATKIIDVPTVTADELILKLETAKTEDEYNVISQEVAKEMGQLSDAARTKVIARGKALRSRFQKEDVVTEAQVIDAEDAMKQESLPVQ